MLQVHPEYAFRHTYAPGSRTEVRLGYPHGNGPPELLPCPDENVFYHVTVVDVASPEWRALVDGAGPLEPYREKGPTDPFMPIFTSTTRHSRREERDTVVDAGCFALRRPCRVPVAQRSPKPGNRDGSSTTEYSRASPCTTRACVPSTPTGMSPARVMRCSRRVWSPKSAMP
ncbi:Uncharacterised protein [Rhodococcus gordoniae]|uniref:Uncharacterized protein n=1 Tax=Rhodococcus gordoniae TaxID=223392 RepID=A0A379LV50_9NOCA|nr:Uncharacterised protein [Rhodococcus gordoniae]